MVVSAAGSDCKEFVSVAGQNYVLVAYFTLNYSAISQIVQRKSLCEIEMIRIPHSNDLPVEVARRIWQRSRIPDDRTPTDRLQGYRLHISSNGARALQHCLPATLFNEFLGSAAKSNQAVNFLDSNLKRLLTFAIVDDPRAESREIPEAWKTLSISKRGSGVTNKARMAAWSRALKTARLPKEVC
jgi:hypothetical protein